MDDANEPGPAVPQQGASARTESVASDEAVIAQDPLLGEIFALATTLPREALVVCRDLLGVLSACGHEELAEVRQVLTAVRQLPGTPAGAKAVLRGGADLVRALDRGLSEREASDRVGSSRG